MRYRIHELIGRGGMGEVFLAEDLELARKVALKFLPEALRNDPDALARLRREAKSAAALDHPFICKVYDVGESADGRAFIVLEYVEGDTLRERIDAGAIAMPEALRLAEEITEAVDKAHQKGILHRDLKPANVMVSRDGHAKVMDFGLATVRAVEGSIGSEAATRSQSAAGGNAAGTLAYMAPEQLSGARVDFRSDLFSLGILLFELFTGKHPFGEGSGQDVAAAILKDAPATASRLRNDLPAALPRLLARLLEKAPERRPESARHLRQELAVLRTAPADPEIKGSLLAAAALVTAFALAGVWWLARRSTAPTGSPRATLTRVTTEAGEELHPSLSPDGSFVVYARRESGNWDIFLRRVGGNRSINLTESPQADDTTPVFSPDGTQIAFRSTLGLADGGLFIMGATGESVRRITDFGFDPSWSPNGKSLVFATEGRSTPGGNMWSELWTVDVAGGGPSKIFGGDAANPTWSPSGHRIAYTSTRASERPNVWTIPADGGTPVVAAESPSIDWDPSWSSDGNHLFFVSDRGGTMSLWRVGLNELSGAPTSEPEIVTTAVATQFYHPGESRPPGHMAYSAVSETSNLYRVGFDSEQEGVVGSPEPITDGHHFLTFIDLSPDETWLAVRSEDLVAKDRDIAVVRTDGSDFRKLTSDSHSDVFPQWKPDGTRISFYSNRSGTHEIYAVRADGSGLAQMTNDPARHNFGGAWSPDGTVASYWSQPLSADPTYGSIHLFDPRLPSAEQDIQTVEVEKRFAYHAWSPDGRWIAGAGELPLYSVDTGTVRYTPGLVNQMQPVWLSDSRRLLIVTENWTVALVDTVTGEPHEVLNLAPDQVRAITLSQDDRTLYFSRRVAESDIWLLTFESPP